MEQRRERPSKQKSLMDINKPGRLLMACLRAARFSPSWAVSAPPNAAGSSGTDPESPRAPRDAPVPAQTPHGDRHRPHLRQCSWR